MIDAIRSTGAVSVAFEMIVLIVFGFVYDISHSSALEISLQRTLHFRLATIRFAI